MPGEVTGYRSLVPHVYRAPLRSRDDTVPAGAGVRRGLAAGHCGMGGRLDVPVSTPEEAVAATEATYGERAARRLRRFVAVPDGAEVWTRDEDGGFHRGTLTGPWRYDDAPAALEADLVHVRPCPWEPVAPAHVPEAVVATFARGGRNFQRIRALSEPTREVP